MKHLGLGLLVCLLIGVTPALADSPLTSSDFWVGYKDIPQVVMAHDIERLNTKLAYYLLDSTVSIDRKAAVINALSWNYHGKGNSELFIEVLGQKYKTTEFSKIDARLTAEERFCLAYLASMDNYFQVHKALEQARMAQKKLPQSFTVAIVTKLIEAQDRFSEQDKLWSIVQPVLDSKTLKMDMRSTGRQAIYDYMVLYKKHSK